MLIFGFDPGTQFFGICILKDSERIFSGTIKSKKKNRIERLKEIYIKIESNFLHFKKKFPLEIIYFSLEAGFQGKYKNVAGALGEARGLIISLAAQHKIDIYAYSPKTIKKAIGIGKATKLQVKNMIEKIYNFKAEDDNEADACACTLKLWNDKKILNLDA